MKKQLITRHIRQGATALLMAAAVSSTAAPFYIVDGQLGVSPDSMPAQEDILYLTTLDSAEAVFIYGERASEGAVVVQTKEYAAQQHYQTPGEHMRQPTEEEIRKAKEEWRYRRMRERREKRRKRKAVMLLLTLLILGAEQLYNVQKARNRKPMTDDEFRQATAELAQPRMPKHSTLDPLFARAAMYVTGTRRATIHDLQQFFGIGYSRALAIIRQLEDKQVIGTADRNDHHELCYEELEDLAELFDALGVEWEEREEK